MKMFKIFLLSLIMTGNAFANLKLDTNASLLKWRGTKVTGEHYGKLNFVSGSAVMTEGKVVSGKFIVDMNSLTVDDLDGEWARKFLNHMKADDFFNIAKYPTAILVVKSIKGNTAKGDLTIKGKTNPIEIKFAQSDKSFSGKFTFDRTKFGMTYKSGNFFENLGDKLIHDEVHVDFKVVFE